LTDEEIEPLSELIFRAVFTAELLGRGKVIEELGLESLGAGGVVQDIILSPLGFEEAVSFFSRKVPMLKEDFDELEAEDRRLSFTIAKAIDETTLERVRGSLEKAIDEGTSFNQWKKGLDDVWSTLGYSGDNRYQIETIFRNNVFTAYGVGRWYQLHAPEVEDLVPMFRYHAIGDADTRPSHAAMSGTTASRDDPIWSTWWPPNGHRCRCSVVGVAAGKRLKPRRPPTGVNPDPGWEGSPGTKTKSELFGV